MSTQKNVDVDEKTSDEARRSFLKRAGKFAVYTPPAVMMLMHPSTKAIAKSVVGAGCNNGVGNDSDCLPPGLVKNGKGDILDNDDVDGVPGAPQNRGGPK